MITLTDAKNYCRATSEDDLLVQQLMDASDSYMKGACTDYATKYASDQAYEKLADFARLQLVANWYVHRDDSDDIPAKARLAITQLQLVGD